ncbi:hypothetical protein ACIQUZ_25825 [Streptomyces griseus]|uniref:Integral membrane protein n=1 Tax=Streptomyces griseus subsp. griseus (strain JCM 4626 / CBS 651.72 / NBRC 13350 / KCC S-0626 / ISP 5235) TaxID=455632 RepID=B1VQJ2_STRGG|nr:MULTISPECIES: hypothetical protein [Streptomyces]MYR12644.1 hypothetical protein [Streptomyces sp. SID724]MYR48030.1 hypothetical protein [Streptomyces sp. SID4928]MYT78825.1 hypothetical protein [Streptomyces sp. SID8364]EGE39949.1 hypothetical protein SACT1_0559 [Streptomyces sp. ACT-1]MBW3702924.1 hypothetical protein [Streptomyces griseus]
MIRRFAAAFGRVAFPSALFTAAGYVLATRTPGPYQRLFEDQWDAILTGAAVTMCGVLASAYGVRLCFSVLGGFQPDNVRRGVLALVAGVLVGGVGLSLLWRLLAL